MALLTRKEVCDKCGLAPGDLSNYIKRQKVYLSGDFIDDFLPANAEFIKKWSEKHTQKQAAAASAQNAPETNKVAKKRDGITKKSNKIAKSETKGAELPKKKDKKQHVLSGPPKFIAPSNEDLLRMNIKTRNEWLDSEKLRLEIEKMQLAADKIAGTLVPVEPTKNVITEYAKGMTERIQQVMNKMLNDLAQKHSMSSTELAECRKQVIEELNSAIAGCVKTGIENVEVIVGEYSDKKGRGERG